MSQDGPRIFLGVPAVLAPGQQTYLDQWLTWFADHSMFVVRVERGAYSDDPWQTLIRVVASTDGVVLLGMRQMILSASMRRSDTDEADGHTSPWLQIEAGIATALGLPVLVAPEAGVTEGVFSSDVWQGRVEGTQLRPTGTTGTTWLEAVYRHWVARTESS